MAASVVLGAGYAVSGLLWGALVARLGGAPIPRVRALGLYTTANLGRYLPGKVWQILGLVYLSRSVGTSPATASAAAILGQALSLVGASAVGLLGLRTATGIQGGTLAAVLVTVVVGGGIVVTVPGVTRWTLSRWGRVLREGDALAARSFGPGFGVPWVLFYAGNWLVYAVAFWLFVRAWGPDVPLTVGPAFCAAYVLGYLVLLAPAGLGVREGALVGLLGPALGVGAVAVAALSRVWLTAVEVALALPFALREAAYRREDGEPAP